MLTRANLGKVCLVLLLAVPISYRYPAAAQRAIPGGFGNGDPTSVKAFRQAVSQSDDLIRVPTPRAGTMLDVIASLLTGSRSHLPHESNREMRRLRSAVVAALDHPASAPSRLYSLAPISYVFTGRGPTVAILICMLCGTATLAMHASDGSRLILSPQLELAQLDLVPTLP